MDLNANIQTWLKRIAKEAQAPSVTTEDLEKLKLQVDIAKGIGAALKSSGGQATSKVESSKSNYKPNPKIPTGL